jgi:hypothetical protein
MAMDGSHSSGRSSAIPIAESEQQRGLLRRVLASPQFAHAETLQRILRFLFENAKSQDSAPKEYEIAVNAVGRRTSFDPKTDAIVRVSIARIRDRLQEYFEGDGRGEELRLELPKGQYRLRFVRSEKIKQSGEDFLTDAALRRFWGSYVCESRENLLLYSELLFFRDDRGNYFRNIYTNEASGDRKLLRLNLADGDWENITPSFHFVSGGEMHAVLSLVQTFQRMHCPLLVKNSRFVSWANVQGSNLIVIGNSRTSSFIRQLQGDEKLVLREDHIEDRETADKSDVYKRSRSVCGSLERASDYALITRRTGPAGGAVTLVMANHARAMEGAMQFLVNEAKVSNLLSRLEFENDSILPAHFQVVLRVEMVDFDEEVIDVEYVTHRIL